jgi:tetratricopeptide (TPR) repeat protein
VGELSALIALPDLDAAEALLTELEATDMDAEVLRGARIALLRARGNEAALAGNAADSLEFYHQVLELDGRDGWTWVALGDLYLSEDRPATAMAYYAVALDRDQPRDAQRELAAQKGELRCYVALDRLTEAQDWLAQPWSSRLEPAEKVLLEREIALALLEQQLADKDYAGARATLQKAEKFDSGSAFVYLLRGKISLAEEDPEQAWNAALTALALDPGMVSAAELLLESAPPLDREARAVEALRTAWKLSDSEEIRVRMEDARFGLAERKIYGLLAKGNLPAAIALLQELEGEGDPGRETRIAAMYTTLGRGKIAQELLDGALESSPDFAPALLARAELLLWEGHPNQAEQWLADSFDRTGAAELGLRRVELLLDQRRPRLAKEQLAAVEERAPTVDWEHRLPLLPLPDGSRPPVEPITGLPEKDDGTLARIDALKERIEQPLRPDVAVGYRFMHQSGSIGSTRMFGHTIPVSLQRLPVGPVDLRVDVLPVFLDDGLHQNTGVGIDAGLSMDRGPLGGSGVLGISPLGFLGGATVVWDLEAWYRARGIVAGLRSGRSPLTDSLSSWGGGLADDGTLFGLVSWTWLGAWEGAWAPSAACSSNWPAVRRLSCGLRVGAEEPVRLAVTSRIVTSISAPVWMVCE